MAQVKGVIAETVSPDGHAVLNADDPLVAAMAEKVRGKLTYFSMQPDNPIVLEHVRRGGIAAIYENGFITILEGDWKLQVESVRNVPVTMGGMAPFMIANALAACLAAFAQGVGIEQIRQGLRTFRPSADQTPGRMNLFNLGQYHALVDYAHNPAGYEAVGAFVKNWPGERVGVVGGPGDRRDEDLRLLGRISAAVFDKIIVKEDEDRRGRNVGEVADLILEGIREAKPDARCEIILDEKRALNVALDSAVQGSLVVIFPETVGQTIAMIESRNPIKDDVALPTASAEVSR
jgi:cyanophycin synthetase